MGTKWTLTNIWSCGQKNPEYIHWNKNNFIFVEQVNSVNYISIKKDQVLRNSFQKINKQKPDTISESSELVTRVSYLLELLSH